jgi:hypothetical protein
MSKIKSWFLEGYTQSGKGQHDTNHHAHPTHPWWKVMCLTGVDYFSTLGYQPSIAFVNAGVLSPIATFVLVLLTLFGALPVYSRIAEESPNGEGSISILEKLLPWWGSKLFVLALLGFAATDFIITITLSAADAAEHVIQNPFFENRFVTEANEHTLQVGITLTLILLLSAVFFKGFKEAIGIAVGLVGLYLALNAVVIGDGVLTLIQEPDHLQQWWERLYTKGEWQTKVKIQGAGFGFLILGAMKVFPKLALGLSGFETGVAVMPQVEGKQDDAPAKPLGRIKNTQKLLFTAALIMSVFLVSSSLVTSSLIPAEEFEEQKVLFFTDKNTHSKSETGSETESKEVTGEHSSNEHSEPASPETIQNGSFYEVRHDKTKLYKLSSEEIKRALSNRGIKWEPATKEQESATGHNQKLILEKGKASGRALAFLAHDVFGKRKNSDSVGDKGRSIFGTVYDISTILILWFAGASAMAGLLNIIPRYLPRYGMAPEWTRANRPLVAVFTLVAVAVTIIFRADVNAQSSAYATGVLVLMTSAAVAVTISARKAGEKGKMIGFGIIALIFIYTTFTNIVTIEDGTFYVGDGIKIASVFIGSIVLVSLLSRVYRTTELRVNNIVLDDTAQRFIREATALRFVPNRPESKDIEEYDKAEHEARVDHHIPEKDTVLFIEVNVRDSSSFSDDEMKVTGIQVGRHKVLRIDSVAIPNAIAAFLLHTRDMTGKIPHAYFNWNEGNPLLFLIGYLLSGTGDIAPVTREVLRRAEPNAERRPGIHAF